MVLPGRLREQVVRARENRPRLLLLLRHGIDHRLLREAVGVPGQAILGEETLLPPALPALSPV